MFDDKNLVDKIMGRSSAPLIVQQVLEKLNDEQRRREDFYNLIGEDDKAEFVNGEIIFHSPVLKAHNDAAGFLYELLRLFVRLKKLGWVGIEKVLTKFTRNDYEPDVCFFGNAKASAFHDNQLLFPVPDLAVEVLSKSSQKVIDHDRKTKYKDYELHGVSEYWIVDPHEKTVEQYLLENGEYRLVLKSSEGVIRSFAVEGFAIPIRAIFDDAENMEAMREMFSR